jgi:hypothetical protein
MEMTAEPTLDRKDTIGCTVTTYSSQIAPQIFKTVSNRLLDVNKWHRLSDSLLPALKIVDGNGAPQSRPIRENDWVRIEPVSKASKTDDFLRIESVEYESDPEGESEVLTIGVSRISEPFYIALGHAKLFMSEAVTTIRVLRKGLNITAELLNDIGSESKEHETPLLGMYRIQWRTFVNGILTDLKPN